MINYFIILETYKNTLQKNQCIAKCFIKIIYILNGFFKEFMHSFKGQFLFLANNKALNNKIDRHSIDNTI
jgi:hypothetical protein